MMVGQHGSFNWTLIDKPRSLILPRSAFFEIAIGSELLMNSLYLPSTSHINIGGSVLVRPFPNIRSIAPICSSIVIDLWYQFKDITQTWKLQYDARPDDDEDDIDETKKTRGNPHVMLGEGKGVAKAEALHLTSLTEDEIMEQASFLSPCPIPFIYY
jgi:hypothetical protein